MSWRSFRNILIITYISAIYGINDKNIYSPILVGSFDIQNFGNTKFSQTEIVDIIKKIILRYDLICLQEIVTNNQNLIDELLNDINELSNGRRYNMTKSERLGRDKGTKEQYIYLYRVDRLQLLDSHTYPDNLERFNRPPLIINFNSTTLKYTPQFSAICIHTKQSDAVNELNALAEVYDYVKSYYNNENSIIMGNMNAACHGVKVSDWPNIALWTRSDFQWLIGHHVDTSTYTTTCANDRIILAGDLIKQDDIKNSANVFDFRSEYSLSDSETKAVSNHFPVEFQLRGSVSKIIRKNIKTKLCFQVADMQKSKNPLSIYENRDNLNFHITYLKDVDKNNDKIEAFAIDLDIQILISFLEDLMVKVPSVLSKEMLETVKFKISSGSLNDSGIHNFITQPMFTLTVDCDLSTLICVVRVCKQTYYN